MPNDKQPQKEQIKVTDRRIFTADGEIREEFRGEIKPSEPQAAAAAPTTAEKKEQRTADPTIGDPAPQSPRQPPRPDERRRTMKDRAANPDTPFTDFIEPLIAQAYMSLGMLRNPMQPQAAIDPGAARQMIEILTLLKEKTAGNLTPDEDDFLSTHLGELKLAYVQRTKKI